jgi:hypothetical protein
VYPDKAILRPFAAVSGVKSIIQSHELDSADNKKGTRSGPLGQEGGDHNRLHLAQGLVSAERSVLAAGAVLRKAKQGENMPISVAVAQ